MFRKRMLNLIRPKCNDTYGIHSRTGLKLLTHLRLPLSHLNDHKFNHNFKDSINSFCSCSLSVENNVHFFLHCHNFSLQRQTLMNNIKGTVMQTEKAPMDDRLRDRYPSCPYL